ncbi:MAG: LacI family DNA-binding transcriptional regulator [Clostridiales bacterium]|nr:LacI family transcriptional regulator [Roseburia sp.]MDD7635626.1 LacI family DNA-binding transcriptional regulator [Clostridiales bacterium]MDY4113765.1 LacI family DNA-binding transcriptional regulator [Roseburia sp.]
MSITTEKEEKKNITIADVAEALGVSKTTVSRAISGKGRIGKETKERVLAYIEEHDYKPNAIAKGLAQSKTYNLCVVMPGNYEVVDWNFFQACLFGIQEMAETAGYDILLSMCRMTDISSLERIIANRKVDGVVLMRTFLKDAQIELLQQKGIPFVTTGSTNYKNVVQIDHNHRNACKELTSIILMKNLKRVALVGEDEGYVVTQSRLRGFKEAYEQMGVPFDESLLYLSPENRMRVDKTVGDILERNVDCILCMDDAVASRVLKVLREKQIKVPDDVRVASFYDSTILENNVPSITSLSFDAKELGRVACQILLDMIEGIEVKERTLLPYEIVLKESTK